MKIHVETKPKEYGFSTELPHSADRKKLAEVLTNQVYELDWAAVYYKGDQYMFFTMKDLIKALQYDKYVAN